jgi:hypothetical protein
LAADPTILLADMRDGPKQNNVPKKLRLKEQVIDKEEVTCFGSNHLRKIEWFVVPSKMVKPCQHPRGRISKPRFAVGEEITKMIL